VSLRVLFHCYLRTAIVIAGERIIIIGLQSFGESIDLAVQLCVHVVIDTLPFIPPNSPVEEALAEWLSAQGRDGIVNLSALSSQR
jgi:ATP-dependent DNA helicase DinG